MTAADGVSLISEGVSSVQDLPPGFIREHILFIGLVSLYDDCVT